MIEFQVPGFRSHDTVNEPACPTVAIAKADERARARYIQNSRFHISDQSAKCIG